MGLLQIHKLRVLKQSLHGYKEELETNIVSKAEGDKEKVNLLNENVKNYIPSLEENDIGRFAVIGGELYYLGNDELSKKAAKNQKMEVMDSGAETEASVASRIEEKAIDSIVKSRGKDAFKYTDEKGEQQLGGIELVNKTYENKDKWKVVSEVENNKVKNTYGNGWYYVPRNTEIEGIGKAKKDYIINYNENKKIEFNEDIHTLMGFDKTMAVKDHLLFNIDPSVIESYTTSKEIGEIANNIKFFGYDGNGSDVQDVEVDKENLKGAFTNSSFVFDGKNDYITFDYDNNNGFSDGIVFEFYGNIKGLRESL